MVDDIESTGDFRIPNVPQLNPVDYPFDVPSDSYLWQSGRVSQSNFSEADSAGRIPVLAIGSNASPSQLTRKFMKYIDGADDRECSIPVIRVTIPDLAVVYSAHLAGYGSMPATVVDAPGAETRSFLTWLTPGQFEQMNASERLGSRYLLREVVGVTQGQRTLDIAYCYASMAGAALLNGDLLALEAMSEPGCPFPRGNQTHAWDLLANDMKIAGGGASLLQASLANPTVRQQIENHMSEHHVTSSHPSIDVFRVVGGTSLEHHQERGHPYVIAVSEEVHRRLGLRQLIQVSAPNNGRNPRVIAYVAQDSTLVGNDIRVDQTIRNALGMPRATKAGPLGFVEITGLRLSPWQWISDKLSWVAGRRYILLRIGPPDPPDIEKNLCRLQEEDLGSLAINEGDHALLLAPVDGRLRRVSIQALRLTESACHARANLAECSWNSRYPDSSALLNIENRSDLRPIWLDLDARFKLGMLRAGDAVMVRRSMPTAILNQLLDFGVVLLASILALKGLIPNNSILAVVIGITLTVAVVILRLRTRLS